MKPEIDRIVTLLEEVKKFIFLGNWARYPAASVVSKNCLYSYFLFFLLRGRVQPG